MTEFDKIHNETIGNWEKIDGEDGFTTWCNPQSPEINRIIYTDNGKAVEIAETDINGETINEWHRD
ncbi:MAG: hypothetical protein OXI24_19210 [Candidatus Poribacteria bacterium]|nr:hypothetical protein [Candidatus Poribacteria bacterium]